MNSGERKKRPTRNPLSPEEVAEYVAFKKIKEEVKLQKFKKTYVYKYLNIFNVSCFFIYCEILICFYRPCHYQIHYSKNVVVDYRNEHNNFNQQKVANIKITDVNGNLYQLVINDFIQIPDKYCAFTIGKDFILQKEIKGGFFNDEKVFRLQRAEPFLFLSAFLILLICIVFIYNLNLESHSLKSISIINSLTIFTFLMI